MPQVAVAAALSTAISAGTAYAAGIAITTTFVAATFAGSLILGGLSYALTPKPKGAKTQASTGDTVSIRQSDLSRQIVYGHTRVTRGFAHLSSTGINGKFHQIIMLCEGELRAINEIWVNDYCIPNDWVDSEGNVTQGRYKGYLQIRKHLGASNQLADSLAVANLEGWTNDHRLQGIAYLYIIMTNNKDVYPTGSPNITAIVEGAAFYDPRTQSNRWSTNIALYCNDFLTNNVYGYGAGETDIDDANTAAQANICDEIVAVTNEDYTVSGVDASLNVLTLSGELLNLIYGDRVTVSSTGSLPSGITASTSYYIIPYQVKTTPRIGLATSLENAMAKVFVDISSAGSGTITVTKTGEPRYHGSGVIDTEQTLNSTMNSLCNSMAGRAVNIGGYWTLLAGAWRSSSLNLGQGDVRGSTFNFKGGLSMSESYNIVKGTFASQLSLYQDTDYPPAKYQQFIDDDNGVEADKELSFAFTDRPTTAQRIAKIELFRGRQGIATKADYSMKAFTNQPGDTVSLDMDYIGWDGKEFEITEYTHDLSNNAVVARLSLRETAQEIYDWSAGEAISFDPAPNTNLPSPFDVQVVTGVQYNSRPVDTRDGDVVYTMQMAWDDHPDEFVRQFGDFEIQFKLHDSTDWLPSFFVDGLLNKTDVLNSSVNVYYDLRIRARNSLGVRSNWTTIENAVVGSSGGVTTTLDWGFVNDAPTVFNDWGDANDPETIFNDWGDVV